MPHFRTSGDMSDNSKINSTRITLDEFDKVLKRIKEKTLVNYNINHRYKTQNAIIRNQTKIPMK